MKKCIQKTGWSRWKNSRESCCRSLCIAGLFLVAARSTCTCIASTVIYDTAPYWATVSIEILSGMGPGQSSTIAETFLAPAGPSVALNDFSFYAESYYPYGGVANLHLRAFVYSWSGSLTGYGGGAVGSALYLSPSFAFSPPARPGGWVPLTAQIGGSGVTLGAGQQYVMGFTLSDPADYAASQGDIEFQAVPARNPGYDPPPIPPGVDFGSGGAVWLNNSNNFGALNTTVWDTWGDIGVMAFTAHFTVVPEPSAAMLTSAGFVLWAICRIGSRRRRMASWSDPTRRGSQRRYRVSRRIERP
jgi:hypothetical protein